MSKTAYGIITAPWSITEEENYDVIMEGIEVANNTEQSELQNEDGRTVLMVVYDDQKADITLTATIKSSNHFGQGNLINSLISNISDTDVPEPLIVIGNGESKTKNGWATCTMTCRYLGTDVTSGSVSSAIGLITTTTSA